MPEPTRMTDTPIHHPDRPIQGPPLPLWEGLVEGAQRPAIWRCVPPPQPSPTRGEGGASRRQGSRAARVSS